MKKLILILLMIGLCCGCQVNYQININEDLTVEEHVKATRDAEFFKEYENSSIGRVVSIILRPYLDTLNEHEYLVNNYITDTYGGVTVSKEYSSLEDYVENTIFTDQYADKVKIEKDGSKVTISVKGKFSHADQDQTKIAVNDASISITLPFKVIENNADNVDGDTYTWNFTEKDSEDREIKLVFNKDKIVGENNTYVVIIGAVILVVLLIVGLLAFKKFRDKKESVNEI